MTSDLYTSPAHWSQLSADQRYDRTVIAQRVATALGPRPVPETDRADWDAMDERQQQMAMVDAEHEANNRATYARQLTQRGRVTA